MPTFKLAMHPASEGDALMLTWGDAKLHHALVDLGRTGDYKALKPLLSNIGEFELFTISHIDADHIEGAVPLFKEEVLPFKAMNVWFNARYQLNAANKRMTERVDLGAIQAEKVTAGIVKSKWSWNAQFASSIVSLDSPEARAPLTLDGDLRLTLLSPSDRKLAELLPVWDAELKKANLCTTDPDGVDDQAWPRAANSFRRSTSLFLRRRSFRSIPQGPTGRASPSLPNSMARAC